MTIQFFWRFQRFGRRQEPPQPDDAARWRADPLSHPAIERMSVREVADLPMGQVRFLDARCTG